MTKTCDKFYFQLTIIPVYLCDVMSDLFSQLSWIRSTILKLINFIRGTYYNMM